MKRTRNRREISSSPSLYILTASVFWREVAQFFTTR